MEAICQTDNFNDIYSSSRPQIMGGWLVTISISATTAALEIGGNERLP